MTTRQITALLAMPAPLRPLLFAASIAPPSAPQTRCFHATSRAYARYLKRPISVGAFTLPHSPALPLSEISIKELLESPIPDKTLTDDLRRLFTQNPATFYHGTSDFYALKKNTRIPEICILGRSNVGKSTFVNALANRTTNELAHTSARAGRTKAMNAFGFGPAPTMKELSETDKETRRTEDLPKHTFFVLDMPGYGHKSLQDWGKHITLYLNKRKAIKGAILLIDGEVGPKSGDLMALELLQEAGLKTAIVLTKADKVKHEQILKDTCRNVWMTMRNIHAANPNSKWEWERDFFVTALGATKREIGIETVAIARLAVARLAGLIQEKERSESVSTEGSSGKVISFDDLQFAPSKLTHAPGASEPSTTTEIAGSDSGLTALEQAARDWHRARIADGGLPSDPFPRQSVKPASQPAKSPTNQPRVRTSRLPSSKSPRRTARSARRPAQVSGEVKKSSFAALEQAASNQQKSRSAANRSPNTLSSWPKASNPRHSGSRFIHTMRPPYSQTRSLNTLPGEEPLTSEELKKTLQEFVANLKEYSTPMDRAARARFQSEKDRPKHKIWDPTFIPPNKDQKRKRKEDKHRHMKIYEARLEREKIRAAREEERRKWREEEDRLAEKTGAKKLRDALRADMDQPDDEDLVHSWGQIEEAQELQERVLYGKKGKKAKRDEEKAARKEEKQRKQRKDQDDSEDDDFVSKFKTAR